MAAKKTIQFFDTLSGKKVPLPVPKNKKPLRFFVCGPTVYDNPHIGNGRTYVTFDVLVRYLRLAGQPVFYLQNITDIDDKIINRAKEEKVTPKVIADRYLKVYQKNLKALKITAVDTYAPATKFIPQIVEQVQGLIKKGFVYKIEGDGYYYDISKFADYGKLARRTVTQAEDGTSRIDESVNKKNKGDFCVWKLSQAPEIGWPTPLGRGRPGWHIEDTAITNHYFGPQYEIHGGGIDIKFPHHEAEIAQAEAFSGKKPFVQTWLHVGSLFMDGKKMSKSLGNFVTIEDFLAHHSAAVFRLLVLSHHYRSPINYTSDLVLGYESSWSSLEDFMARLTFASKAKAPTGPKKSFLKNFVKAEDDFWTALADDFNTPQALGAIFSFIAEVKPHIWKIAPSEATTIRSHLVRLFDAFGLAFKPAPIPLSIQKLAAKRETARRHQQFMQSDELRKKISELGYSVDDTPSGPFIVRR